MYLSLAPLLSILFTLLVLQTQFLLIMHIRIFMIVHANAATKKQCGWR